MGHFEANYAQKFDEYYRLWRGIWAQEDVTRESERSRIISPALQQAVESSVAEIEEATFGRGKFFDITDDANDPDKADIVYLRNNLHKDFEKTKVRKAVAECLINSAVFGTGIAEVVRGLARPVSLTKTQRKQHLLEGHANYHPGCQYCVRRRGLAERHEQKRDEE